MISFPIITALALLPFVLAQSNDTAVQIEAIEAHFTGAGIVPSLLSTFVPSALLNVSFDGTFCQLRITEPSIDIVHRC